MARGLTALVSAFVLGGWIASAAAQQAAVATNRWEPTIQKFEADDAAHPPAKGGILFIGASSIARWKNLAESFPDQKVVNRGFGGSELSDAVKYATRVVVPHAPRIVVLYAGENDLDRGATPPAIGAEFVKFHDIIRKSLPNTRVVVIGLKPSLLRWKLRDGMRQTNKLIQTHCESQAACSYVDPWPSMIGADGTPKPDFFVEDGLHMTPAGYKAWTAMLKPYFKE
jgi:lysophospholipase L1-like esterase